MGPLMMLFWHICITIAIIAVCAICSHVKCIRKVLERTNELKQEELDKQSTLPQRLMLAKHRLRVIGLSTPQVLMENELIDDDDHGICDLFYDDTEVTTVLRSLWLTYHDFSGDTVYPVKSGSETSAQDMYNKCSLREHYWGDHPYGNNRRALCAWLADQL